jgi:hypothetical protein
VKHRAFENVDKRLNSPSILWLSVLSCCEKWQLGKYLVKFSVFYRKFVKNIFSHVNGRRANNNDCSECNLLLAGGEVPKPKTLGVFNVVEIN